MPFRLPTLIAWLAALCVAFALVPSAATAAEPTYAPPGSSAIQEFLETLPDGAGSVVTNDIANALAALPPSGAASSQTRRALVRLGPRGRAAAGLAETTAVGDPASRPVKSTGTDGKSPFVAAFERLGAGSGPGGMGLALPIAILLSLLSALGYGLRQRAGVAR